MNNEIYIKSELNKLYPDKIVCKLSSQKAIYSEIYKTATLKKTDIKKYIESLGYKYTNKLLDLYDKEMMEKELLEIFPDKKYKKIGDITKINSSLYNYILKLAKKNNQTTEVYLKTIGYTKNNERILYDYYNLGKLILEYNVRDADIAKILDCSRENIRQRKKTKNKGNNNIWIRALNEKEIDYICDYISKNIKSSYYSKTKSFMIVSNQKNESIKALICRFNNEVKVVYTLPSKINDVLKKTLLDIYSDKECSFLEYLGNKWEAQKSNKEFGKKQIILDINDKNKIKNFAITHEKSVDEYLDFIGYTYKDMRSILTDADIIAKIEKYTDLSKNIEIHVVDEDYHFFAERACRKKLSIYDFFESYGYHYDQKSYTKEVIEKRKNKLLLNYIVTDKTVYIPSYDPFYALLSNAASKKGLSITKYVNLLGFKRISNIENLPLGYIPYDCTNELINSKQDYKKNLEVILAEISNMNNQVYIDVNGYLYYNLFLIAKIENKTINEVIKTYGYERVFKRELIEDIENKSEKVEYILEDEKNIFIRDTLKELKEIQSKYSVFKNNTEKIVRNKKLVAKLKDLYQGKCQLCNQVSIQIPSIVRENGELYSEVHHITALNESKINNDDIEFIDSYKNTIVLCPYHHKFVHFQNGGFKTLISDDGEMYLKNDHGEKVKIHTNYHLK